MSGSAKASVAAKPADPLARLRAKVQVLRRQVPALGEDETWRAFLALHAGGEASTRAMGEATLRAVVQALHAAGAPRVAAGRRPRYADAPQMRMIRGLWLELADLGAVKDRSETALGVYVKRQTKQDLGALTPSAANRAIEGLKAWRARVKPAEGAAP